MANESRVFRLPAGMSTQVVANAVSSFLSSAKGMEVQSAEAGMVYRMAAGGDCRCGRLQAEKAAGRDFPGD